MIKVKDKISLDELKEWENCVSPNGEKLVKAVIDIEKEEIIIGGFLHVDEEEMFIDEGSLQENLWGINLYLHKFGTDDFIEYDSMINIRPNQQNNSRYVENEKIRKTIKQIIISKIHNI